MIVNLFKDGSRADPGNYRGIAIISCLGKLYLSLWARRLAIHFDIRLDEAQSGFRQGRGAEDQLLSVYEVLLRRLKKKRPTYLFFIDFSKAFDTVWHDGLWKRLWDSGVKGRAWRVLRSLYSGISAAVKVGDRTSRFVRVRQGVRQGCPLSPTLFNCFVDELSARLTEAGLSKETVDLAVRCLMYADDIVLLADSPDDLQRMINVVDQMCRDWHLSINLRKSQVMVVGAQVGACKCKCACHTPTMNDAPAPTHVCFCTPCENHMCRMSLRRKWKYRGNPVPFVSEYKYLGVWFTEDLKWSIHIGRTTKKAKKRSLSLRTLLTQKHLPPTIKILVWLGQVRPLLEYGAQVWEPTAKERKKMESVQTQAGVLALRLNRKTKTEAVRALMHCTSLQARWDIRRLLYSAKLLTMLPGRKVQQLSKLKGPQISKTRQHWANRISSLIDSDSALKKGYEALTRIAKHIGILPTGWFRIIPRDDEKQGVEEEGGEGEEEGGEGDGRAGGRVEGRG